MTNKQSEKYCPTCGSPVTLVEGCKFSNNTGGITPYRSTAQQRHEVVDGSWISGCECVWCKLARAQDRIAELEQEVKEWIREAGIQRNMCHTNVDPVLVAALEWERQVDLWIQCAKTGEIVNVDAGQAAKQTLRNAIAQSKRCKELKEKGGQVHCSTCGQSAPLASVIDFWTKSDEGLICVKCQKPEKEE